MRLYTSLFLVLSCYGNIIHGAELNSKADVGVVNIGVLPINDIPQNILIKPSDLGTFSIILHSGTVSMPLEESCGGYPENISYISNISDKNGDGVFLVSRTYPSGGDEVDLRLIIPKRRSVVSFAMFFWKNAANPIPECTFSENANNPEMVDAKKYIEQIRWTFGYLDEREILSRPNDSALEYYYWARDNKDLNVGKINIKKLSGPIVSKSTITGQIIYGNVQYTSYAFSGVMGFDKERNEHFVLYHSRKIPGWPQKVLVYGHTLIIGTLGDGLVVIDLEGLSVVSHIKIHTINIESLSYDNNNIIINGDERIPIAAIKN